MLDLKTILVVTFAIASLQAIAWIFVWLSWRRLYELKFLAAGFSAIAIGVLLMILRDERPPAWSIVLANTVIKLGLVLLAYGLARFLEQPRYTWISVLLLIFQVIAWSVAVTIDPGNIAIRIHASTFFTVIIMSMMCMGLMRDRTQPPLLRWITIGVLVEYIVASLVHSAIEAGFPDIPADAAVLYDRSSWYALQGTLFLIAMFACLLFMVSSRLSADLRDKNRALSQEILERRKLEHQLNASLAAERALRDEQVDFMRVISHEFRTPLAIIRNSVDMIALVGGKSSTATRERLSGIGEALDRLFSLIDRFMANDRDNGFQPEPMQIGSLIADVRLHFDMTKRGDRLNFVVDDEAASLVIDPEMMATILINLIDNALKYSPADEPVFIETRGEQGFIVIQVRDRGIGIPEADSPKIGRRFFRASNATYATGTGLGLYSAHKLLAYHGGTLELLSEEGNGTTAIVCVPWLGGIADRDLQEELTT